MLSYLTTLVKKTRGGPKQLNCEPELAVFAVCLLGSRGLLQVPLESQHLEGVVLDERIDHSYSLDFLARQVHVLVSKYC